MPTHPLQVTGPMWSTKKSVAHAEKNVCNIRFGRTRRGGGREREKRGEGRKRKKPLYLHLKHSRDISSFQNGLHLPTGVIRVMIFPSGGGKCDSLLV